jgi:hypothetical protein
MFFLIVSAGMLAAFAFSTGEAQARVHAEVAAALARGDDDLTDQPGPDLSALLVLAALAVLDVGPLGMSGHEAPLPRERRLTGIVR